MEMFKCDKCDGTGVTGYEPGEAIEVTARGMKFKVPGLSDPVYCDKCSGTGQLNWLENLFGKKPKGITIDWSLSNYYHEHSVFEREIINKLSEQISLDIDKEILKELLKDFKK